MTTEVTATMHAMLVVAACVACGTDGPRSSSDGALDRADKLIAVGQCDLAEEILTAHVAEHPDSAGAFMRLGHARVCLASDAKQEAMGQHIQRARKAYESATKIVPSDPAAIAAVALTGVFLGEWDESVGMLATVGNSDLSSGWAHILLAIAEGSDERLAQALKNRTAASGAGMANCSDPSDVAVIVEDVADGKSTFSAGAVISGVEVQGGHARFPDMLHAQKRKRKGWVMVQAPTVGGGYGAGTWRRQGALENAPVISETVPDGASGEQWAVRCSDGCGPSDQAVMPVLVGLGLQDDVVPGSVRPKGDVKKAFVTATQRGASSPYHPTPFVFQPVSFEKVEIPYATVPAAVLAFSLHDAERTAAIVAADYLSEEERCALLRRQLYDGVPLYWANLLGGERFPGEARLVIHEGHLAVEFGGRLFVDGFAVPATPPSPP